MTSWNNSGRGYAQVKKMASPAMYFEPTQGGFCSNLNMLFYSYLHAVKQSEILYVHDHPNAISDRFPLFESILKVNSSIIYMKEVPKESKRIEYKDILNTPGLISMPFARMKTLARDLFSYNGDTQGKILDRIRQQSLERTVFDVGVHIRSGDKITTGEMKKVSIQDYITAIQTFQQRLGKSNLKIFVMTDNMSLFAELQMKSPTTWSFTTLQEPSIYTLSGHVQSQFNSLSTEKKTELFYQFLTELHIMQNIPNLVVSFSSHIGRFLYLTSRLVTTKENILSVDVPEWSAV